VYEFLVLGVVFTLTAVGKNESTDVFINLHLRYSAIVLCCKSPPPKSKYSKHPLSKQCSYMVPQSLYIQGTNSNSNSDLCPPNQSFSLYFICCVHAYHLKACILKVSLLCFVFKRKAYTLCTMFFSHCCIHESYTPLQCIYTVYHTVYLRYHAYLLKACMSNLSLSLPCKYFLSFYTKNPRSMLYS
jgi:hypothetical protein